MGVQENVQVVKNGFAAFGRRDIPGLLALMSEDVEWISPGTGMPLSGTRHGRDGVASFFQDLARELDISDFQPREFIADGDRVLVVGWERTTVKSTNRTVELDWIMAFTVRNGKITSYREYTDTQAMAAAYESAARAAS